MSDSYREQWPLLNDDYSDEDVQTMNAHHKRRNQPFVCGGRARNYAKGAAAIITRWPDNCSTSVTYWWLGVSMFAIITFVIYNSVLIFGMIPMSDLKLPKYRNFNTEIKPKVETLTFSDVFMHIVINNTTNILLNKYLPHVRALSKKYPNFKYTFLLVLNDTSENTHDFNDDERNEIALSSLWVKKNLNKKISSKYNIYEEYVSLTAYLNDSPIKKFWRHLPAHIIEFLLRSVSIWEKGGIAFNPVKLISKTPGSNYIQNLHAVFTRYINSKFSTTKVTAKDYLNTNTKRPNNIQDIINALDKIDTEIIDLSEAENNDIANLAKPYRLHSKFNRKPSTNVTKNFLHNFKENKSIHMDNADLKQNNISNVINTTENILPIVLKNLFIKKPKKEVNTNILQSLESPDNINSNNFTIQDKTLAVVELRNISDERVISTNTIINNYNERIPEKKLILSKTSNYDYLSEIYVDIKGNIIASKAACHAFLGTMFSNVFQHAGDETITEFIISELSLFCNGVLTSCAGVNVILA